MKRFSIYLLMLGLLLGCSSQVTKQIETEKKSIPEISSNNEMVDKMRNILEKAPALTSEQKDKFIEIHDSIFAKALEINHEIRKLKIVLFRAMVDKNYDKTKVNQLIAKIKSLYSKKLDLMLNGMVEVKEVLGVAAEDFFSSEYWGVDHMYPDMNRQQDYTPMPPINAPLDAR